MPFGWSQGIVELTALMGDYELTICCSRWPTSTFPRIGRAPAAAVAYAILQYACGGSLVFEIHPQVSGIRAPAALFGRRHGAQVLDGQIELPRRSEQARI